MSVVLDARKLRKMTLIKSASYMAACWIKTSGRVQTLHGS